MSGDYIDAGDRVVIKSDGHPNGFGGQVLTKHKGKHGLVLRNDGFGRCAVLLDDGVTVEAWNRGDLEREPPTMSAAVGTRVNGHASSLLRNEAGYYYVRFGIGSRDVLVDWWAQRKRTGAKCVKCFRTILQGTVCIAHYVGFKEPTETWCVNCAKDVKSLDFNAGPDFGTLPK